MHTRHLTTHSGKLKVSIPANLKELTVGQVMQLQDDREPTDMKTISILSGVPMSELLDISDYSELSKFMEPVNSLIHQLRYAYDTDVIPEKVTFKLDKRPKWYRSKKVTVKVRKNLRIEPAGAFLAASDIIADEVKAQIAIHGDEWDKQFQPSLKAQAVVLAHYFYCPVTGEKYSEYGVDQFLEIVKRLSVAEASPIAKYFFLNFPILLQPKISFWQALKIQLRKKQEQRYLKNIATLIE